jgi:N-acetylneuraminic acid mutarotase
MEKFYYFAFKHKTRFILKGFLSTIIFSIAYTFISAQNFTAISWGTAASQKYGVSEAQGRVVNGKLYSFGGFDSQKSTFTPTKRAYVYNPLTNTWSAIADLPYTPNGPGFGGVTHAGITTDGTDVYIAGGYTSDSSGTKQIFGTKQVWKYIISQNVYTKMPDLPIKIAAGQLEYVNGKLHYIGGTNSARTQDLGNHYVLDLNNLTAGWKTLASLPNPRNHAGSAVYEGKIYFIGGQHGQDSKLVTQKETDVYDPATNTWTRLADMPVPSGANGRGHISSGVVVMGNRIIVLGGEIVHQTCINMVSAFSPYLNSWTNLTPLPQNRYSGVAGVMAGDIFYTGGAKTSTTFKGVPFGNAVALSPVADAFVRNGSYAGTNYGSDTALIVKGAAVSGYTRTSYLKFSLNNISTIDSAKLRIYGRNVDNTTAIRISAYGTNNDSWPEDSLTFNNAPARSTAALSSAGVSNQEKYYELDVTSYVKAQLAGDKMVSILIQDPANQNSNLVFSSKENRKNPPQLVITTYASRSNITSDTALFSTKAEKKISEFNKEVKKIVVYPNPLKKRFTIKFPDTYEGDFYVEIADQSGRVFNVGKTKLQPGGSTIYADISRFSLRSGIYFLKVHSSTKNEEIKLIIQ